MVVGSTLQRVTMLFLSNSENSHVKHSKAIYITSNITPHSPGYFSLCQIIVSITIGAVSVFSAPNLILLFESN